MSATSSSSLPTPRQLLTSVLNAISSLPAPEQQQAQGRTATATATATERVSDSLQGGGDEEPRPPATNPLRLIDPAHRPLFTTLHVLFPSLLLPALDLLDRGLVTRLLLGTAADERRQDVDVDMRDSEDQDDGDDDGDGDGLEAMGQALAPSPVYLVRSAQKPTRRPYGGGGGGGGGEGGGNSATSTSSTQRAYLVQTSAWNCTCAAFAFSAFPPVGGGPSSLLLPERRTTSTTDGQDEAKDDRSKGKGEVEEGERSGSQGWQFGGLSLDGLLGEDRDGDKDGEAVPPCCKHLLACVLAERWEAALGRYMARRTIGREEMAGIFADI